MSELTINPACELDEQPCSISEPFGVTNVVATETYDEDGYHRLLIVQIADGPEYRCQGKTPFECIAELVRMVSEDAAHMEAIAQKENKSNNKVSHRGGEKGRS